jgi:predicted dehydrogenase
MSQKKGMNRRQFLRTAASATAVTLVPRHVLGGPGYVAPSEKVNVACIGVGAQGTRVMMEFLSRADVKIASVCDVNKESHDYSEWGVGELRDKARKLIGSDYTNGADSSKGATCGREPARRIVEGYYAKQSASGSYKGCSAYNDYRELLEKEKDVDAVIVGTPDHTHAAISIAAMKKGKHVFCQKPMTHSVAEARRMAEAARETKVATQVAVGNQASEATRLLCEWIWNGAIGPVREVHNWSARPYWPQGHDRPENAEPVPTGLDWDLWIGPAPFRPYHHIYLPFVWRGWRDFGTGAVGDMGCYSFDTLFRVLRLETPTSVEACPCKEYSLVRAVTTLKVNNETFPHASIIRYHFPARGDMPPVTITWYDGGMLPPRPEEMETQQDLDDEGMLFVGDKGKILCGFNGANPRLIPDTKMKAFQQPPKTFPRSVGHNQEWIDACKGGKPGGANFEFEARVTETLLLGNVAMCAGKKMIRWDGKNLKSPDLTDSEKYINPPYREGWTL